jgi:beta-glucanase (GH16 family)
LPFQDDEPEADWSSGNKTYSERLFFNPKSQIQNPKLSEMNFWKLLVVVCLIALSGPFPDCEDLGAATAKDESQAKYQLVWADEFDQSGRPNPKNWTYETGFVRNEEMQWYQPQNAWCENGMLIIEGRRERKLNPSFQASTKDWRNREYAEYTSASLTTKGLHSWQYGRFEMRGRIDTRLGLWPAFWTLGVEGEWPNNGEIDIMEFYRATLLANVAWGSDKLWEPIWDSVKKPIAEFTDAKWSEKFHIWRMDWDDSRIQLYVDDILLNSTELKDTSNRDKEAKNPFRQPHYILLDLAVGGHAGGDPSQTKFPARFEVDYVRVYKHP